MKDGKIRVLVVDDSAVVRQAFSEILSKDPALEVMSLAADPLIAAGFMRTEVPDVILLDLEMPRMDGLTFLRKLMAQHPVPVIVCSTLTSRGSTAAIQALESGALEIMTKPAMGTRQFLEDSRARILEVVKGAAGANVSRARRPEILEPRHTADVILAPSTPRGLVETTEKIIAIGASTGGTEALREILTNLPADCPGIAVVQHMPEQYTRSFAARLNEQAAIHIKEAENGDRLMRGQALIAPGNRHLLLRRSGAQYHVEVADGPAVNRHRPSVDVLFRSTARYAGPNATGVILTGMGDDGARGMLEMKQCGARTIAQDEATCVVFGMPKEAIRHGGVDEILPLGAIAGHLAPSVSGNAAKQGGT